MKQLKFLFFIGISLFFSGCTSLENKKKLKIAGEFYETYSERKDLNKLMSFYANSSPQWIDAVAQSVVEGKEEIKSRYQYEWEDKNYKKNPQYPKAVKIEEMLANDSVVVVNGRYNPYYYNGNMIHEMNFTAWLYFDKEGKIKKQIEWMQYSINDLRDIVNFKQNAQIN